MKIILLGTAYPYRGGLAEFNERLTKQFNNEGHQSRIETFTLQYPDFLFPGKTQYSTEAAPADLDITRGMNAVNPLNWIAEGRKLKKECPDLIVVPYWVPQMAPCFGTIARIARSNHHTKVVAILHNVLPHERKAADKMLSGYFIKSIDGGVTLSKSVMDDLDEFDKQKPRAFCRHPLYDNFGQKVERAEALKELNLDPEWQYLLFFGFIRDYKGLDLLLDAFADDRIRQMKVKLLVAGEFYGDPQKYFDQEKRLNLQNIIWSNDFIPNSKVGAYFGASNMVVLPYKSATQSGVTQVAFHFEKPMLVTNVGGLSEIVPDGKVGYVVEPDAHRIADAIVDYIGNNREEAFTEQTRQEKLKYSWENMTKALLSLAK